ncbi:pentapeptide repeat-containing protein [Falsiruegeria mediterranea]|uniref:Secreted effector protein PipB2 n=1 Tax=Falsiruegeria mediterranea M17 TaxID=1200281 RepID=A0A2R8CBV9_9RHOB|nr:pentapeptide repeat-containing protein [Falsiruegeria mediterranea]SPJ29876.1 hypothetical protein TRM7615_03398 [Falsiruegeria mediterranea M17]
MSSVAPFFEIHIPLQVVVLLVLLIASLLVYSTLDLVSGSGPSWVEEVQKSLGLLKVNRAVFLSFAVLWGAIFALTFFSLWWFLVEIGFYLSESEESPQGWVFQVSRIVAFTTVLGAIVALPITLIRLKHSNRSLGNTKITSALEGLSARRETKRGISISGQDDQTDFETGWEVDISRRVAALDALYGIVEDYPDEGARITRLLEHYVRAESPERSFVNADFEEQSPAGRTRLFLRQVHPDIQVAMSLLGAMGHREGLNRPDLTRHISLDRCKLLNVHLAGANFDGALLSNSDLRFSNFEGTSLRGTNLSGSYLQGARLNEVEFYENSFGLTEFYARPEHFAHLDGASFRAVEFDSVQQISFAFERTFGDGSVRFRSGITDAEWPDHWPRRVLTDTEFSAAFGSWKLKQKTRV